MKYIKEIEVTNCVDCPNLRKRIKLDETDFGYKEWYCHINKNTIFNIDRKDFRDKEQFIYACATNLGVWWEEEKLKVMDECPLKGE